MSRYYEHDIEITGQSIPVGDTTRTVCPVCAGGSSNERSMAITNHGSGAVKYICFRAACGIAGIITGARTEAQTQVSAEAPTRKHEPYTGQLFPLEDIDRAYFEQRFLLDPWNIHRNELNQYVLPIRSPNGTTRGHVVRLGGWKGEPYQPRSLPFIPGHTKVKSYKSYDDAIMQSFYGTTSKNGTFVLVEDQISAMRVTQDTPKIGVALLGTELTIEKVRELQSLKPARVIMALDADASKKAFTIARDFGMAFKSFNVVLLERDIKDLTPNAVQEILSSVD